MHAATKRHCVKSCQPLSEGSAGCETPEVSPRIRSTSGVQRSVSHARLVTPKAIHAECLPCSDSATTGELYSSHELTSIACSGEAVPQQPVGSLYITLSLDETGTNPNNMSMTKLVVTDPDQLEVADDVTSPAIISSAENKEDQPADNAAAAVVANIAACECGKVKLTCSAPGCQQQYCRDCALDANKHDDFHFCSRFDCCGNTMYCGDHFDLVNASCHCDTVICRGDTQECHYCEKMLCINCANDGAHEVECCANHCDSQSISY